MAILSAPLTSTSGLAPVLSATIRFWISVDSLNRPPTLLTIPSSFSSSSIAVPSPMGLDNPQHVGDRPVQVVVDHLIVVLAGAGQFEPGPVQAPPHGLGGLGAAAAQPLLQRLQFFVNASRGGVQEDRDRVGAHPPHLGRALHVNVQNNTDPPRAVSLHLCSRRAVVV